MTEPPSPIRRASRPRPLRAALCSGAFLAAMAAAALAHGSRHQQPSAPQPTLRFAHGGNAAEVPMELASNAVFVPVRVDQGLPSSWLLDTGSARSAASPAAYPEPTAGNGHQPPVLSLPGLDILGAAAAVHSLAPLDAWYGQRVSGVIGDDLLSRLVAELDYSRRSIELYEPASYRPPHHVKKLEIRWIQGLPTVRAKLRLGGRTVEGDFVLNTGGNAGIFVSNLFLAAHRMFPYAGKTIPGSIFEASGERAVTLTRGEWLEFASFRISKPIVAIERQEAAPAQGKKKKTRKGKAPPIAGWIGGQILRKFRIVLDFPSRRILLAPNDNFIFPIQADASGATITAAGPSLGEYEVRAVATGSPAAVAGLLPGDRFLVIDGEPVSDLTLDQVRELLSQAGHTPVLSVLRLGRRVRIQLHLSLRL